MNNPIKVQSHIFQFETARQKEECSTIICLPPNICSIDPYGVVTGGTKWRQCALNRHAPVLISHTAPALVPSPPNMTQAPTFPPKPLATYPPPHEGPKCQLPLTLLGLVFFILLHHFLVFRIPDSSQETVISACLKQWSRNWFLKCSWCRSSRLAGEGTGLDMGWIPEATGWRAVFRFFQVYHSRRPVSVHHAFVCATSVNTTAHVKDPIFAFLTRGPVAGDNTQLTCESSGKMMSVTTLNDECGYPE